MAEPKTKHSQLRKEQILQRLLERAEVTVEELVEELGASPATIRRDLAELEREGLLRRTHGGASLAERMLYEPFLHDSSFEAQVRRESEAKRRIGLAAASLVADNETISLTPGTTTTQVARSIRHRRGITVITTTVNVAMELSNREDLTVFVAGGFLRGSWFSLVGSFTIRAVSEFFVDKVFIGVNGIHAEKGLTCWNAEEAAVNRALIEHAKQKIVVADHTKLGALATALICPTNWVDILITDTGAAEEAVQPFRDLGIEVILV
ncbi:transcriptional regulator, DeoR family [Thermobaculum terrenum ATCC BAA-798]|uniref:Transcriptional regulator, DeoR family n=1 Tax=Thermobaculum terrenum (strain ATCC BAA-798 / CCMEE 7001 / YNP1) TaxID=525904 RepID=D1CHY3_THET1|nr:DeoR/GlpR family DNA-binding transcription regulator [Thermobaculum terrenum]ACZ43354.1 transcriptional regulator, DeoR family [Thermobaculum terrenum ATCC BAA-798]